MLTWDAYGILPYFLEEFLYFLPSRGTDNSSFITTFLTSSAYFLVVVFENQVNRPKPHRKGGGLPDEAALQRFIFDALPPVCCRNLEFDSGLHSRTSIQTYIV